jgi:hypothetical protein
MERSLQLHDLRCEHVWRKFERIGKRFCLQGWVAEVLSSRSQPRCEPRRQVRGENAILRVFQVIRGPVEVHDPLIRIVERECGPPIAIARLPN